MHKLVTNTVEHNLGMEGQPPLQFEPRPSRPEEDGLRIWSCVTCRRRKVKCDRKDPCGNCLRNNIDCHFPVTGRLPRRSRDPNAWKSPAQKQSELLGRLRRLESLVTEMTGQLEDGPNHQPSDTRLVDLDSASSRAAGQLLQDQSSIVDANMSQSDSLERGSSTGEASAFDSYGSGEIFEDFGRLVIERAGALQVDKGFWSIFCDEVDHIFQAIHDDSSSVQDTPPPAPISQSINQENTQCHGFGLGGPHGGPCISAASSLDDLSPLPSQMLYIWKSYVENVDPFINILHVPTMDSVVSKLRRNFSSLGRNMEALLFAISFATVVSLDEEEVLNSFRVPRADLMSRFRLCTERALAHCQFLTTNDITVFQAFVVYVATLPHVGEQKLASSLTGSLVRVAASLKLHVDPDNAQRKVPLDAVEAECRRRLWWQVCFLDSRSGLFSLPGLTISEASFDTKLPSNVDGILLQVDSTRGVPATSPIAMSLTAIRCENWLLNRSIRRESDASLDRHLEILEQARDKLEKEHLQYLRPDNDFDSLVAEMTHLFLAKVEQSIHRQHLRRRISKKDNTGSVYDTKILDLFFSSSVSILAAMHDLKTKPAWKRWRWQLQGQFPWRTVGDVFIQMCRRPSWTALSEKAWNLARKLIDGLPPESRREVFWERLNSLASAATAHRDLQMGKKRVDADGAVGFGVDAGVPGFSPLSAAETRDPVLGPADVSLSSNDNNHLQSWMTIGDQGDFGFSNTTFATKDGYVPQHGGTDSVFDMTKAPTTWLEWDDLIDMDLF